MIVAVVAVAAAAAAAAAVVAVVAAALAVCMGLDMAQSVNWSGGQRPMIAFVVEYGAAFVLEIVGLLNCQRLGAASSRHR